MAALVGRMCGAALLKGRAPSTVSQVVKVSTTAGQTKKQKYLLTTLGAVGGGVGALWFALDRSVSASDHPAHAFPQNWSHNGWFQSLDHASIRRGYEVYKQVCAACHSLKYFSYRNLEGVSHTEEEVKAEAAEAMVKDGPDDAGNYFMRPGKPFDAFVSPYENEQAARAANNGAYPPDLSYVVNARRGGEDYIFALLTGYCDPPAGVTLADGQYYNPYFPGGAISMAQALYNETIEYSDGTPATASQLAKDVSTFLRWASEPEYDERQRLLLKTIGFALIFVPLVYYMYRFKWATMKTRKIAFKPKSK